MVRVAVLGLSLIVVGIDAGRAQDIAGIEDCTKTSGLDKRTGCLQSNVNFLQRVVTKIALEASQSSTPPTPRLLRSKAPWRGCKRPWSNFRPRRRRPVTRSRRPSRRAPAFPEIGSGGRRRPPRARADSSGLYETSDRPRRADDHPFRRGPPLAPVGPRFLCTSPATAGRKDLGTVFFGGHWSRSRRCFAANVDRVGYEGSNER
jgi:hypothetical protein